MKTTPKPKTSPKYRNSPLGYTVRDGLASLSDWGMTLRAELLPRPMVRLMQRAMNTMPHIPGLNVDGIWGAKTNAAYVKAIVEHSGYLVNPDGLNRISDPRLWLEIAEHEIGEREVPGSVHNNRILEYHGITTLDAKTDEVPWCSSFVCWVMEKAGFTSTRSAAARSWLSWGKPCAPLVGAIVVLKRGTQAWQGHVGFVVSFNSAQDEVHVLGGNQSNAVNIKSFSTDDVLGYRWPEDDND